MDRSDKIFITGATGFLGSYITRTLLASGYEDITALRRKTSKMDLLGEDADRVRWVEGDLFDHDLLSDNIANADVVIHAAALVSFLASDYQEMLNINVEGTAQIVNHCLHHNIRKLIFISSVAAIGRSLVKKVIHEDTEWVDSKLNSKYGITKQYAEREAWRGYAEGLPVVVINPSYILGAGYWKISPTSLYKIIYNGMSFYGTGSNGVVDVRDVAKSVVDFVPGDRGVGERYIVCAENMSHKDLFSRIAIGLDKKKPTIAITPLIAAIGWRVARLHSLIVGRRPIVTKDTVKVASEDFEYDNSKVKSALDFEFRNSADTISDICASFLSSFPNKKDSAILPI